MRSIISVIFFLLLTVGCSFVYAQAQPRKIKAVKNTKSILILKDTTSLETSVAKILIDSLSKKGYTVKQSPLADLIIKKASKYNISIIFSAVTTGENMDPRIDKFIASKGETTSEVKIFTVCGAIYDNKDTKIDALTQASSALHPQMIADQILKTLKL
jgi:sulfite reductase alpha subunit-like flavoprotein